MSESTMGAGHLLIIRNFARVHGSLPRGDSYFGYTFPNEFVLKVRCAGVSSFSVSFLGLELGL